MEDKSKNIIIYFLLLIILVLSVIIGIMVIKKDADQKVLDNTKIGEKNTDKEPNKEESKEAEENEEKEEKPENNTYEVTKKENQHNGCAVCDADGGICCGTGPETTADILIIDVKDEDFVTDSLDMISGTYQYTVKYTRKNNDGKVIVNGKTIFNTSLIVEKVFVLDNGMIGIEYYDDMNQASLKNRVYFDNKLNKINSFEGLKQNQYVLDKGFEYTEFSNECINNEYREYKVYRAVIEDNSIETKMIKKDKENNCAGMT